MLAVVANKIVLLLTNPLLCPTKDFRSGKTFNLLRVNNTVKAASIKIMKLFKNPLQ